MTSRLYPERLVNTTGEGSHLYPTGLDPTTMESLYLDHTAEENDDHALEIDCNAAGFGDVKAIDIVYVTGAIATGGDEEAILIQFDEVAATGGDLTALEVLTTTEGSTDKVTAVFSGVGVAPLVQLSGTFGDADSILNKAVDVAAALANGGAGNISVFVADNDTITIGHASEFQEVEMILDTAASGGGIAPTFEFSTAVDAWTAFSPADGTNGLRNNGVLAWLNADIPTWAVGTGSEFLIRITRTRNNLSTTPILDEIQIAPAVSEFGWDKLGDIACNDISAEDIVMTGDLTGATLVTPTIASFTNAQHDHADAAGGGTLGTTAIDDEAITYAKMQHVTAARVLGRGSLGGTGDVEELTATAPVSFTGTAMLLNGTPAQFDATVTGDAFQYDSDIDKIVKNDGDDTWTTDTTLATISDLSIATAASEKWHSTWFIHMDSPAAADIKFAFVLVGTALASARWGFSGDRGNNAHSDSDITNAKAFPCSGADQLVVIHLSFTAGAGSATIALQAAQNASSGTTTVYDGSSVVAWRSPD